MRPNTERDYRNALQAEGLLEGAVEEIAAPEVLRAAVERHLPLVAPGVRARTTGLDRRARPSR